MKILFITPVLEYPPAGGPALRIVNTIKVLRNISELHILSGVSRYDIGGTAADRYFLDLNPNFGYLPSAKKSILFFRWALAGRLLNTVLNFPLRALLKIRKTVFYRYFIDKNARSIVDYLKKNDLDIIWFGYGNVSLDLMKKMKSRLPRVPMVCDTDSVWSRFILRELDVETRAKRRRKIKAAGRKKIAEEKAWVEFMDVTTAVSEIDADYYREISTDPGKIKVFSNGIDMITYSDKPSPPQGYIKPSVYLAGTFWEGSPMENAARWVINEIFPIVKKEYPKAHLYIIGSGSDAILSDVQENSVTITGKIDSVLPYLCHADVSLVPLKYESGTRFKILEAGACKIPVVSTTLGAEGLKVGHAKDIWIADTAGAFAQGIIRILKDPALAEGLAENLHEIILESYSLKTMELEAREIIKFIEDQSSRH